MSFMTWVKGLFSGAVDKFKTAVQRLFNFAQPFVREVLSLAAQEIWNTSKDLLIEAVKYVAVQGLPTGQEKRDAFYEYMRKTGNEKFKELRERDINILRELALSIYDKASE